MKGKSAADRIIIGIAGGSGSGKSTISDLIRTRLHPHPVEVIGLDRFFKPIADMPAYWSSYHGTNRPDFNRPDSLMADEMISFCRSVSGRGVALLEGHFALYYPELRQLMDVKCFVEAGIEEMLKRRTERNLANNYGGGAEEIFHYNRECVAPAYQRHILPTRAYADIVIPNDPASGAERDAIIDALCARILTVIAA
jgi:uridine kinase